MSYRRNSVPLTGTDGLARGNIFSSKVSKISFQLTKVYADSAIGSITRDIPINKGDLFEITDRYRSSDAFIKIFIPELKMNTTLFMTFFNRKILPLTKSPNYIDYYTAPYRHESFNYVFTDQRDAAKEFSTISKNQYYSIVIPAPSDVATSIRTKLAKDQNIKLVKSEREADVILYLNYAVASVYNGKPSFVFTYRPPSDEKINVITGPTFFIPMLSVDKIDVNQKNLKSFTDKIQTITTELTRSKTTWWLNGYPRR
ncbi:MAG: hypothetical protein EOP48_23850 [Sphingobacteriales bacterium]|nr:MAG: hypothetical protein EOP48_23850 [Sphingobacteriales bacterium]